MNVHSIDTFQKLKCFYGPFAGTKYIIAVSYIKLITARRLNFRLQGYTTFTKYTLYLL